MCLNLSGDQGVQNANDNSDKNATDATSSSNNTQSGDASKDTNDMYAEEYFSSGSDDEHQVGGQASKSKERRKVLTNDELLYDPDMDDEDERWVIKQRQEHRQRGELIKKYVELNDVSSDLQQVLTMLQSYRQ